jgi:hypothetical protein
MVAQPPVIHWCLQGAGSRDQFFPSQAWSRQHIQDWSVKDRPGDGCQSGCPGFLTLKQVHSFGQFLAGH